ncbi:unnamed protein product, partial [Amoebophrya sp. A25]
FWHGIWTAVQVAATSERIETVQLACISFLSTNGADRGQVTDIQFESAMDQAESGEMLLLEICVSHLFGMNNEVEAKHLMDPRVVTKLGLIRTEFTVQAAKPHPAFASLQGLCNRVRVDGQRPYHKMPGAITEGLPNTFRTKIVELDEARVSAGIEKIKEKLLAMSAAFADYDPNNPQDTETAITESCDAIWHDGVKESDPIKPLLSGVRKLTTVFLETMDEEEESKAFLVLHEQTLEVSMGAFPE